MPRGKATKSELRRIDSQSGEVLETVEMPAGVACPGSRPTAASGFLRRRTSGR